jgi:P27 family predicted phage terminase small subunit
MPGPPPTPTRLKLLRGNPGHQKLRPEPEPLIPEICPKPPPHITGYAADEWWIIAPELHRLGLLTRVDVPVLAIYCHAYGQWRLAAETLAKMAANDRSRAARSSRPSTAMRSRTRWFQSPASTLPTWCGMHPNLA